MAKKIKTQTVFVTWETDGQEVDLPDKVKIPAELKEDSDITDYLSDKFGWLVYSFAREQVEKECIKCNELTMCNENEKLPYCKKCEKILQKKIKGFHIKSRREQIEE